MSPNCMVGTEQPEDKEPRRTAEKAEEKKNRREEEEGEAGEEKNMNKVEGRKEKQDK